MKSITPGGGVETKGCTCHIFSCVIITTMIEMFSAKTYSFLSCNNYSQSNKDSWIRLLSNVSIILTINSCLIYKLFPLCP